MDDDRLWITPIVRMEILYSARSTSEYIALETELDGFRILATTALSPMPL
jgi:predicted nucleic acid-binding protein